MIQILVFFSSFKFQQSTNLVQILVFFSSFKFQQSTNLVQILVFFSSFKFQQSTNLIQILVFLGSFEFQLLLFVFGQPCQHAVKGVVVPLALALENKPALLQQVLLYAGPFDHPILRKVDVDVLSKSGGVVVTNRLSISKGCQLKKIVFCFCNSTLISEHDRSYRLLYINIYSS